MASLGLIVLQDTGDLVVYASNHFPGPELVLDWGSEFLNLRDIADKLREEGVDSQAFLDSLL